MISEKKAFKHTALKDTLWRRIQENRYAPGDRFLSARETMRKYSVSAVTVSRAMRELVKEGVIERRVGGGTFVKTASFAAASPPPTKIAAPTRALWVYGREPEDVVASSPLNWFILSEIQKGIVNSYQGSVRIFGDEKFCSEIRSAKNGLAILINPRLDALTKVKESEIPYVLIDQNHNYLNEKNRLTWEPMIGIYALMAYLIRDLGHRRIGLIDATTEYHRIRRAAYRIGLETYGIAYDAALTRMVETGSVEAGYVAAKSLLEMRDPPTAIFADTDLKAIGAIKAVRDLGLRVPEDVSIAGFDDIPRADELDPPLTTVKVPYYEMGETAARLALARAQGETLDQKILFTRLVIRDSCAPSRTARTP